MELVNKQKTYNFKLISSCTLPNDVSFGDLKGAIQSLNNEEYITFNKYHTDKILKEYSDRIVEFQMRLSNEIFDKYRQNIILNILENKVNFEVNFDITVPNNWNKYDIIEWCEGINRCIKAYLFLNPKNYKNILNVMKDMEKGQNFKVKLI